MSRSRRRECSASVLACVSEGFRKWERLRNYFLARSCSQSLNELQDVPATLRREFLRSILRPAVLKFVTLLEQTTQSLPRIAVQSERFRRGVHIHRIWIDLAAAGRQRRFYANNSRSLSVIFTWRCVAAMQFAHKFGSFMLKRSDPLCLAIIDSGLPNFPTDQPKQRE